MLRLISLTHFQKDLAKAVKRNKDVDKLKKIIMEICKEQALPAKNRNHKLSGNYVGHFECHIEPNWLLIYKKNNTILFK